MMRESEPEPGRPEDWDRVPRTFLAQNRYRVRALGLEHNLETLEFSGDEAGFRKATMKVLMHLMACERRETWQDVLGVPILSPIVFGDPKVKGYCWLCLGIIPGWLREPYRMPGIEPGQPSVRQAPCLLYYCSGSTILAFRGL